MLQKLIIRNYAIIEHLVFEPDGLLNTITGETGAGKSIILGALSLIMGDRADSSILINKNEKSVIEGYFDVENNTPFQSALADEGLDFEPVCIIRREIAVNGKSRAFINDTPVNLNTLNGLVPLLIDMHRQFGHLSLEDDGFQMQLLDAVADAHKLLIEYKTIFSSYRTVHLQLSESKEKRSALQKEADYKQYLLDELVNADFKEDEIESAELRLKQISNAEKIKTILESGRLGLADGDNPILNQLKLMNKQLISITEFVPELKSISTRIASVWEELKDITGEIEKEESKFMLDPELADTLQQRLDLAYKLLKKHFSNSTADLIHIRKTLTDELKETTDLNETIEKLAEQESKLAKELIRKGEELSTARRKNAPIFIDKMNRLLNLVGMPNAKFKITLEKVEPTANGMDGIKFLLDANKSGQFQLLQKVASGGEMSRIMLCIKSLTAKALHIPTLVFDEVDAGISGEAARQVSILLREISKDHQIICVTHQPQVAARGTRHYYVYKEPDGNGMLTTKIKSLSEAERVEAIAKMIGGEKLSEAAINNAKELIGGL